MYLECYNFSGIKIGIQGEQELKQDRKLAKFETEESPDFQVILKFVDILPDTPEIWTENGIEWHCYKSRCGENNAELPVVRTGYSKDTCTMLTLKRYSKDYCGSLVLRHLPLYHVLLKYNAIILHASYILINGKAILFSAPSGTGKSTQAQLWEKSRGAEIINGDRALIRKTENGFTAGGIYYSGTSGICRNVTAPLRAIVLLGQSEQSTAEKCGGVEAFRRLFRQCAYTSDFENDPAAVTDILVEAVNNVDIVKLDCLPDESAVKALEDYLSGDN